VEEKLAIRIVQFSKDFDFYSYSDSFENDEEAVAQTLELLAEEKGRESLIAFFDDVLESEDEKMHQEAEQLKRIVNQL